MDSPESTGPARTLRTELAGGDALGHGDQPTLSWWLPEGARSQLAYRITTADGYDSGRVESARQSYVPVEIFDRSRRSTTARVQVWTDLGTSIVSESVSLDSGLLQAEDWTASWIGVAEPERPAQGSRPAYWLRSIVDLPADATVRLHVTSLGLHEVFLNGERVGDEELAPGYTQYLRRVQRRSHDISGLVHPGRNVVAVLLADGWFRGQVGMPRLADQFGTELALRLQVEAALDTGWTVLAGTDPSWQTSVSHVSAADLIGGQREDRRAVDPAVHDPAFEPAGGTGSARSRSGGRWQPAVARDVDVAIVAGVAAPIRRIEQVRPISVSPVEGTDAVIVDLGQNINGWVRLGDLGVAGSRIELRHGESLDKDGDLTTSHLDVNVPIFPEPLPLGQIDEVVSAGVDGDWFEPRLTTHGFRYVRIAGHSGRLTEADITGVVVHSDLRRTGWFECSDERLNRLHEAAVWSLRGNMCGIPTDCPQRERAGWTGDWQVFAPTAAYLYDVLGFTRSWLRDVALDQRADGCVANMSPCPPGEGFASPVGGVNGSAGWGDVVVSAPWDLHEAYGDLALLRETFSIASAWVEFAARTAAQGRHPSRTARRPEAAPHETYLWDTGFHWGEWLEPGFQLTDFGAFAAADKAEVATAYLHRSAATLARTGALLGADAATLARYSELAEGTRAAWQAEFVGVDGRLAAQTQAAHVRALAFGLVPQDLRATIADRLVELIAEAGGHLRTGFLSTGLLLPTLADNGHLDAAYELLLQDSEPSWLTMIDRGGTTVWEHWNGIDADGVAHDSLNHYSKGAVVSFLHRQVAGLQPTEPGYRSFRVQPRPGGGINWARTTHECPYGPIDVSWYQDGPIFRLDVAVPGGTSAEVVLPDGRRHAVGPGTHRWPA
ncbi:glycoside hydrolase family 78 protein [Jatrophihabitans telluris]|uniref:alpha-L-rhamnosidase n=1 Tax=Jatrophihabitans telluris TaxID=2038343 RepID=A0ABY4QWA5_9ACTN|nr:family 78 glycoside hydrolase catalytic domain [Jatrophihabitans telluris]UQX87412.1 glycoside hydrolase family 78 protein [Jatrophihabitans telluris]